MLSGADWAQMRTELIEVRGDNSQSITIRRGGSTLAAQTVRIAARGNSEAKRMDRGGIAQNERVVVVSGDIDFDVQIDDRFNDGNGDLYEVFFVSPNRRASVQAQARMIE